MRESTEGFDRDFATDVTFNPDDYRLISPLGVRVTREMLGDRQNTTRGNGRQPVSSASVLMSLNITCGCKKDSV